MPRARRFVKDLGPARILIVVSTAFHLFTVLRSFGWGDDWAFLSGYRTESAEIKVEHTSGMRPALQIVMNLAFGSISTYGQFTILRLVSVLGFILFLYLVFHALVEIGFNKWLVTVFLVLVNFLPTFWIYINWATVFSYTWVCVISLLSLKVFRTSKGLGLALSTLCFLTYQPAAVVSIFLVFSYYLHNGRLQRLHYSYMASLLISSGLAYGLGKALIVLSDDSLKARTDLVDSPEDLLNKVIWVVTRPVLLSLRPFMVESRGVIVLILTILGVIIAGLAIFFLKRISSVWSIFLHLSLFYFLALLPLIVIQENQIEFRTLPTTSLIGLLLLLSGIYQLFVKLEARTLSTLVVCCVSIVLLSGYTNSRVNQIFVQSFSQNKVFIQSESMGRSFENELVVLVPSAPWPQRNYIGSLSVKSDLQMPWVPLGQISQILRIDESKVTFIEEREIDGSEDSVTIDLGLLRTRLSQ